jgi:serine protease Do
VSVLRALETPAHLTDIAEHLRRITVEIHGAGGGGAGILWAPDLVVTNAHVVDANGVRVTFADDRRVDGHVDAVDRRVDLALLRVPRRGLVPATSADPGRLRVGALVVALGHPLGLRRMLTAGVIHALGPVSAGGRRWIRADVRLAPGNSGGPLADTTGAVVGVNTMIAGGLALAIPIDDVHRFVRSALGRSA